MINFWSSLGVHQQRNTGRDCRVVSATHRVTLYLFILFNMKFVHVHMTNKNKMKWKWNDTTENNVHSCQHAINLRLSPFAIRSIQYSYFQQNQFETKSNRLRQRSTEDSSINASLPQHEDLIPDVNSSSTLEVGTISLVTQHVGLIMTNRWLYSSAINCVPNNETNELIIARITLCNSYLFL